ncbi:helix-turn-helix domain-containing protein [Novosphingopyxis sp. YJ-S2-01]|uniref:helix-turn-helix domain-containing protein n=1 Tax=Novosphingopyxis sp. YJ-S2-01 TaxID=2794021 RepID=UPI0018DD24F8|nr:helix-turn-helix domain-containing protein [Novosphingopyxis sp. YJ-S2-01]MBH9537511.1 helix-turn-helix domain-containing protein [Novosphingopyxis sp. YJ-S2-01]
MSVRVMSKVWEIDLPDSEKIVLLALADAANDEGTCWPSMKTLATKCSKSDRTVQGAIQTLCKKGLLNRKERLGKGCLYTVLPDTPDAANTPEAASPPKPLHPRSEGGETPEAASDKPSRTIIEPKGSVSEADEAIQIYLEAAKRCRWPGMRKVSQSRRKKLALRLGEVGLDGWREAIARAEKSGLLGAGDPPRWFDFDFLVRNEDDIIKLLEGKYDRAFGASAKPRSNEPEPLWKQLRAANGP